MKPRALKLLTVFALACQAWAQTGTSSDRRVELLAAEEAARSELRGQLLAFSVANGVSMQDLVKADPSFNVDALVSDSQSLGGPRWIDQDVVQVRVQLSGSRVVQSIEPLGKMGTTKLSDDDLKRLKSDWAKRNLQATGQAIPPSKIPVVVAQSQSPAWRGIPQQSRMETANRARDAAIESIVKYSSGIELESGKTIGSSYGSTDAMKNLYAWAATMPATRVAMADDQQVELSLYIDKEGLKKQLAGMLTSDLQKQKELISKLDDAIKAMPTTMLGKAAYSNPQALTQETNTSEIHGMPDWMAGWMSEPLQAEGSASNTAGKLRAAREAEQTAQQSLRKKILSLKIDESTTIEQAISTNPNLNKAVDRAITRAKVYQVDYNPDGSVVTRVTLDPNELMDELNGSH